MQNRYAKLYCGKIRLSYKCYLYQHCRRFFFQGPLTLENITIVLGKVTFLKSLYNFIQ